MNELIGQKILHYRITELIGKGEMGVVYKAEDLKLKRWVAIKLLPPHLSMDAAEHRQLEMEARAAAALNHPNIATIYTIEELDGQIFIVMEYIEGKELGESIHRPLPGPHLQKGRTDFSDNLQQGKGSDTEKETAKGSVNSPFKGGARRAGDVLPVSQILNYTTQIAKGLQAAHEKGVIHQDIKSSNIMITPKNEIRIMDFGLATMGTDIRQAQEKIVQGTIAYMAPELWEGHPADACSDIWSLGVVIYELLTGQLPFSGNNRSEVIYSIINENPAPLNEFRQDIPDFLIGVVEKSLAKNRNDRYSSISDLIADLEKNSRITDESETSVQPKYIPFFRRTAFQTMAIALVLLTFLIFYFFIIPQKSPPQQKSIAVLPFIDMSPAKDQEYFCDGIAEELINSLAQIEGLYVAARTSAFQFKNKNIDIRTIGRKLNVGTVVEGSVRKSNSAIKITAQLINVENGYHIWSEVYERNINDIFSIQENISKSIVAALKIRLIGNQQDALTKRSTENPDAYTSYLKGRYYWNKRSETGLKRSIRYFKEALVKDGGYARAYGGIADAYIVMADWGYISPNNADPKAKTAATKALELDETLADAYSAMAYITYIYEWKADEAEALFKEAIRLNSNYATAHQWYAEFLTTMGRSEEALAEIDRAQQLDPLSLIVNAIKGWILTHARRYDEAIAQLNQCLEMDPDFMPAHTYLRWTYEFQGQSKKAVEEFKKVMVARGVGEDAVKRIDTMFTAHGLEGVYEWYLEKLKEDLKHQYVAADEVASTYLGLGDHNNAMKWLEIAYQQRIPQNVYLRVVPIWDPLRDDPRFVNLLEKIGLE